MCSVRYIAYARGQPMAGLLIWLQVSTLLIETEMGGRSDKRFLSDIGTIHPSDLTGYCEKNVRDCKILLQEKSLVHPPAIFFHQNVHGVQI